MALITDQSTTPELNNLPIKAKLSIQEINFKNSQKDFLKFLVETEEKNINLKGLEFYADKVFKTIKNDFLVKNGDLITLYFNSKESDSEQSLNIYTEEKGLTATTEQILLKQGDLYLDFFCWQKSPISESEKIDFDQLYKNSMWEDQDIASCFDSGKIEKDQSIVRVTSDQNSLAWTTLDEEESQENPTSNVSNQSKLTDQTDLQTELNSKNENISPEELENTPLQITEIFPAPSEKSTSEWIEINNNSEQLINLNSWILDDDQKGSKPAILNSLTIGPNQYLKIDLKPYKINLNNTSDQVRLFNPDHLLISQVEYTSAIKNNSYSLINKNWLWTAKTTPASNNPVLTTITGKITNAPQFKQIYFFEINDQNSENYQIIFDENLIKAPEAKTVFTVNSTGSFVGELSQTDQFKILKLYEYQLDAISNSPFSSPISTIIVTITITAIILIFLASKHPKWSFWRAKLLSPFLRA